ncbi:MAG: hypothetical protein KZQ76_15490 [Candidatus Thiodiazotropha sp. (ex Epidulcina cf. delphinae)]|nr:hypothetical protein [Candidatus Thiodiazotropha sp. (ex Epidulcina cf. delphinae)]
MRGASENERRFTADAAHELRTPLAALKTLVQAKSLVEETNGHRSFLDQIICGVDHTTHLLEQLLTLARMDSRSIDKFPSQKVDLHAETINILSSIGTMALEKDIDPSYDGVAQSVAVPGYMPGVQILLRNLIDNSIRYTPDKGQVSVSLEEIDGGVRFEVEDSGPGIPEEQWEGLYQRFRRGEGAGTEGSGLGLSIVKRIVDLHHASIKMCNRTDQAGLLVSVIFPTTINPNTGLSDIQHSSLSRW